MNNNSQNNFRNKEFEDALENDAEENMEYETDEETTENENTNQQKIEQEQFRAKMLKLFGIVIIGLIVVLGLGFIFSLFSKKYYKYSDVEDIMKDAAISYFKEYPKKLPSTTDESLEVNSSILVENKEMKELDYYLKGKNCKGNVTVDKVSNKEYTYTPYLKCGTDYETTTLYDAIKDKKNIVTSGYGLYIYNGEYVYRGSNVNNYVKFSDSDTMFRAVKVTKDNEVVLIQDEASDDDYEWDSRYNQVYEDTSGINDYKNSKISETLSYYYKSKKEQDDSTYFGEETEFLTKEDRKKTVKFKNCVGRRSKNDTSKDGSAECSITYESEIGLLPVYDFLNASIDPNCTTTTSPSCQNYNYIAAGSSTWLANGTSEESNEVYILYLGYVASSEADNSNYIRPIIHLSDKVMLEKGKGTKNNPYIIR